MIRKFNVAEILGFIISS